MPGLRFLSVPEMQQNTFSKAQLRTYRSSGKGAAAKDLHNFSKRGRPSTEPSTPENEPVQKGARIAAALPGNLIHLSQSADGKLRWLPPSSSISSSLNEGVAFSGCFSGDYGHVSIISPALIRSENAKSFIASRKLPSKGSEKQKSSEAGPASPSLTSCCRDRVASDSTIIHSSETVDDSDVQEVSFRSHHQAPSSELSISSQHQAVTSGGKTMLAGVRDLLPSRTCGLSPYLSSKLKPGKHILGVKKHQNYIRPGQLRHWAVGNSPSLASSLANLPTTSLKGKACRTLSF